MTTRRVRESFIFSAAFMAATVGIAAERASTPFFSYDSGIVSAETLGRGGTIASNRASPAAGSENPASLDNAADSGSLYATTLLKVHSNLPKDVANGVDPLDGKVLQYLAVNAEKGVLFFEPVSRINDHQILDDGTGATRDVDVSANAIGFAGASKIRDGAVGLSIAYLWSDLLVTEQTAGTITRVRHDTMDGLRLNLGVRYPTGPAMWGLVIQNGPGFLWGSEFRREQLPLRIRAGNTYRLAKGVLFSVDGERRFYNEGGKAENYLYLGNESFLSDRIVARVGVFGTNVGNPGDRHATAGLTISAASGTSISYAFESFRMDDQKVNRSVLSVQLPFVAAGAD